MILLYSALVKLFHENYKRKVYKESYRDFPGGAVVRNLPANAGDTGLSPGLGGSHVPRSN